MTTITMNDALTEMLGGDLMSVLTGCFEQMEWARTKSIFTDELVQSYLELAIEPMRATLGRRGWTTSRLLIAYFVVSLWACLPQLAFALIGGFLSRHFRIRNGRTEAI